jgi:hypothetical protein
MFLKLEAMQSIVVELKPSGWIATNAYPIKKSLFMTDPVLSSDQVQQSALFIFSFLVFRVLGQLTVCNWQLQLHY